MKQSNTNEVRGGFVLLEVLVGVMIFALGVLALGRCVNNCLGVLVSAAEDQRARLALENRMAEVEAGEVKVDDGKTEKLEGLFAGMTMKMARKPCNLKNEKNEKLDNLYNIGLVVAWKSGGEEQQKSLSFYVLQTR